MNKLRNEFNVCILTILLGAVTGVVIWGFLRVVGLCTVFLWEDLPEMTHWRYLPLVICAAGGLLTGLIRKKYGDYPEELHVVLGKVKREKHYDYDPMPVMLICAMLPLIFGASVGPEAGMTGIIAGLCYWIGDNVKYAKEHAQEYSEIGAAVTLAGLFHVPLFGIFAVEENEAGEDGAGAFNLPKVTKLLLYALATASAFLVMKGMGSLLGAAGEGFPSLEAAEASGFDLAMMLVYVPIGLILFLLYFYAEKLTDMVASKISPIVREGVCGLCIGIMAIVVPAVIFSGEEQLGILPDSFVSYAPVSLIGICLLKLFMTALCIKMGLKGGHFFPLIYGCSCMGYGIAMMVFAGSGDLASHTVFAAAIVTAAMLGAQLKKPFAVSMLLLICFPFRFVLWMLLAAAVGGRAGALIEEKRKKDASK